MTYEAIQSRPETKNSKNSIEKFESLPKQGELLTELNSLQFPATQHEAIKRIIQSGELQFKGTVRQHTADVLYGNLERLDSIKQISSSPVQKQFIAKLERQINTIGNQNQQWESYKKERQSSFSKNNERISTIFKGIIALGLTVKSIIDFKNNQTGLGAVELGIAGLLLRVDKWIDPMNSLVKEVQFIQTKEWKALKPRNVKAEDWTSLCKNILQVNGIKTNTMSVEQKKTWDSLSPLVQQKLAAQLRAVKTDSGKKTVISALEERAKPKLKKPIGQPTAAPIPKALDSDKETVPAEKTERSILENPAVVSNDKQV